MCKFLLQTPSGLLMRFLYLILLLFCFAGVEAQQPVYPLNIDTVASINLPHSYLTVFYDESHRLSFTNMQSHPVQQQFQAIDNERRLLPGVYWLHYSIQNGTGHPVQLALQSNAGYVTFYVKKDSGEWQKKESGLFQPWAEKDGLKQMNSIPLSLQASGVLEVYQRNNYWQQVPSTLSVVIQFPHVIAQQELIGTTEVPASQVPANQLLSALIAGVLLFAAIIYIRFYWTVRVRFYLYYSLFLFAFAVLYSPIPVFLQGSPVAIIYISYFSFGLGLFFFTQFFRSYLRTHSNYPLWDKWLMVVSLLPLLFFLLNYVFVGLFPPSVSYYTLTWGNRTFILVLDSLLITSVLYISTHKTSPGIIATIPALLLWGVGQTYKLVAGMLQPGNQQLHATGFIRWLNDNTYLVDLLSIVWIVSVFSSLLFQRFQHLQKRVLKEAVKNERLKRQKEKERIDMIARQKNELEQKVEERTQELKRSNRELVTALRNLKETQKQLVQSEKMASLGELTAGVAHEIQNPLNFITNFSEVGAELAEEIENALQQDDKESALAAVNDMKESLQKIAHHGRRAGSIVKGMLQHSRSSTGAEEPTNINALADEYLRLSFHGLRARDKDFNARFTTDFDSSIGLIEVVPQDLGRVLLNLFNNAFYAVNEKKKLLNGAFEPVVFVQTKKLADSIEITVKDNGTGIPSKILEKIYQPFFTTKPAGEGTGLGLSLSYDIVKSHSGEMQVETSEGEGTEFKIILPAKTK